MLTGNQETKKNMDAVTRLRLRPHNDVVLEPL